MAGGNSRFVAAWRAAAPYRPLIVLMLVSSTASFAALGALSLFARNELGASDTMVTVNFVVVALASMAVLLATGHVSDLRGVRRVIIPVSLAWLGIGYAILASVRSYPAMLAVGVVFFCAVGVPNAQLMAYARDLVERRDDIATSTTVIAMMRVVLSIGSFTGFGIGGLGLAYLGARPLFRIVAVACLGCLALSWYLLRGGDTVAAAAPQPAPADSTDDRRGVGEGAAGGQRPLLVLVAVMVLFSSGRVMLLAQLPILVTVSLHAPVQMTGIVLALPPLCELVLMPIAAFAALRWGRGTVFLTGGAAVVVYYGALVVVTTPGQLMLLQVVYAVFGAATVIAGLDLAQRLMAGRAGTATSIYLSHENVATVNGSLVATVSVAALGHQLGFVVPAVLCLIALAIAGWAFTRCPGTFDLRRRPPREQRPLASADTT
ncbi:MFS transporter [Micromonospora sp. DR5-3]|uniref:MFS transporter n=1 Tax=unclassified Micromonospora TaxID=2617518 RepID=UPI0011D5DCE3|nr:MULTISPECIES: MFS transporter [unclassified Micromonospora]MCW3816192.1 MFS transporter [Micromonospora sp. DR5-3]TYC19162.1 MFS transporter [Micromonospora sp. MP36]